MDISKVFEDLEKHKTTDRKASLEKYIRERLTKCVQAYYAEIDENVMQLYKYDSMEVLKKLRKAQLKNQEVKK